jgi:4-diphosphocytidyl-2-C-methyl-D-erythritol kinase
MTAPPGPAPAHGAGEPPGGDLPTAELRAPAKLTLELRVTGRRPDGLHTVEAEMVTLDLADHLIVRPAASTSLRVVAAGSGLAVTAGPDNLVRRALAAAGVHAEVVLHKRIPAGAGLGGGSADAAAVLRWAGVADTSVASSLGADVPFCLVGGRARVSGIGEVVEPLPTLDLTFTLLIPPFGVPTGAVYRAWDDLGGPSGPNHNDLESAALAVEPRLGRWRDALWDQTATRPRLAGSGGTWFVSGEHPAASFEGVAGRVVTAGRATVEGDGARAD